MISPLRLLLVLALLLLSLSAQAQTATPVPDEWSGTDAQKLWGLMTVWSEVKYTFPHLDRLAELDWDAKVQATIPGVLSAEGLDSYYELLMELVAGLEDSHTSVLPPWGHLRPGYDFAAIELRIQEGRFQVARVGERTELAEQGILPGVEIIAVEGMPVREYFSEHVLRIHSMGSPQADQAILIVYLLYGPGDQSSQLTIRDLNGVEKNVSIARDALSGQPPFMTRMLANTFAGPTIRTRRLEGGIQYVEIPNFEHEQARQDFESLIDGLDASQTNGLIIDLRYNMGGSDRISEPMVACLIDQSVVSPTMKYRHFVGAHEAWGREVIWESTHKEIQPRDGKRYLGPLVILTGGVTNSSAEDFAIELRSAGRARLVGQRTAGGAGNALVSTLPGGGTLRVATFTALTPEGEEYVGVGIAPDVEIQANQSDLVAAHDPVLECAVELIRGL